MAWCQHKKTGSNYGIGDINKIKRLFYNALETDKTSKDIIVEMLRHNVPLHCGGMSDPFQAREKMIVIGIYLTQIYTLFKCL